MSDFGTDSNSEIVIEFETRIKHYFGWTVNASAGTESISSEDSNAFWNAYSLSLAKAVSPLLVSLVRIWLCNGYVAL